VQLDDALVGAVGAGPKAGLLQRQPSLGELKERGLPASELLQEAVRAELRRQALLDETDTYVAELTEEVGRPTFDEVARAEAIARRLGSLRSPRAS
jgi:hypothetical protein